MHLKVEVKGEINGLLEIMTEIPFLYIYKKSIIIELNNKPQTEYQRSGAMMHKAAYRILVSVSLFLFVSLLAVPVPVKATVGFEVNTAGDGPNYVDTDLSDGECKTIFNNCSLRAAIQQSNPSYISETVTIYFDIPAPYKITLASELPMLYANIIHADPDRIIIDGNGYDGLTAWGSETPTITGLQLQNFASAAITYYVMGWGGAIDDCVIIDNLNVGVAIRSHNDTPGVLTLSNNYIGYDPLSETAKPNLSHGIDIEVQDSAAGGSIINIGLGSKQYGNVISGNLGDGIRIFNERYDVPILIKGNYIGTSHDGTTAVGNSGAGIHVPLSLSSLIIGGDTDIGFDQGNVIAGNLNNGIDIYRSTTQTLIQGNSLSTNLARTSYLPNTGLDITASDSSYMMIGGDTSDLSNVILNGIRVFGITVQNANLVIKRNFIGLTDTGFLRPTYSATAGIYGDNLIGYPEISFNEITKFTKGIVVGANSMVPILNNHIYDNSLLGIDLNNDGVTPNDPPPDADTGPNGLQNFPEITNVEVTPVGSAKHIMFDLTLGAAPSTTYRLQVFSGPDCSPSGFGEGKEIFYQTSVTTDANGYYEFNELEFWYPTNIIGPCLTATATLVDGPHYVATSEFSPGVMAWQPEKLFLPLILK